MNRWRRYGKDRLYVETPDGTKVGFWDLIADSGKAESPEQEAALLAAVADWKSSSRLAKAATATTPVVATDGTTEAPSLAAAAPRAPEAPSPHAVDCHDAVSAAPSQPVEPQTDASDSLDAVGSSLVVDDAVQGALIVEPMRPWVDLATNAAGTEARERAQAARDSAPVKTALARVLGIHTNERAWRIGADGEEKVAAQLAKLARKDPRWQFLHAIPVGNRGSDIDHIIIGPGGVFTANAKHHPGAKIWVGGNTFMVNGAKQPYIRNARHEAQRAAKVLTAACGFPVHVEGLIVTVNASDVVVKNQPEDVSVTPRMQVARWLLRHGDILTVESIAAIYEVARRSTTWR